MDKKLQDKLFEKYPKIFRQRKLPMQETCMCWGLDCGEGWYQLLDTLCSHLQWDIDRNGYPQIEATQVKEKFGTLRFYYGHAKSNIKYEDRKYGHQDGMISYAEFLSGCICEQCGSMNNVQQTKGWIATLCPKCMKAYKKKRGLK